MTEITPLVAPIGIVTAIYVAETDETVARTPLNFTMSLATSVSNPVPVIITPSPTDPDTGKNPPIVGEGMPIVNFFTEDPLCPPTVTLIVPVVVPPGTTAMIEVAVAVFTVARDPLNMTVLFARLGSKLEPLMVTSVPACPYNGVNPVMIGNGIRKYLEETPVCPLTLTVIDPVFAPVGTFDVILVAVDSVTSAAVPPNITVLFAGTASKSVPVMVTTVSACPDSGVNPEMTGTGTVTGNTVKLYNDVAVLLQRVTMIVPDEEDAGTITVSAFLVAPDTYACILLKQTMFSAGVVLNSAPDMITVLPGCPDEGEKLLIEGAGTYAGTTIKLAALAAVRFPTVMVTIPVLAPDGTLVLRYPEALSVTVAPVPLNVTILFSATDEKLFPLITISAPTKPDTGDISVITGIF